MATEGYLETREQLTAVISLFPSWASWGFSPLPAESSHLLEALEEQLEEQKQKKARSAERVPKTERMGAEVFLLVN